jgi:hypothetical protein
MAQVSQPVNSDGALSTFRRFVEAQAKDVMRGRGAGPRLVIRGQRVTAPKPRQHVNWLA